MKRRYLFSIIPLPLWWTKARAAEAPVKWGDTSVLMNEIASGREDLQRSIGASEAIPGCRAAESRLVDIRDISGMDPDYLKRLNNVEQTLSGVAEVIEQAVRAALRRSDISISWSNIANDDYNPDRCFGHFRVVAGSPPDVNCSIPPTTQLWNGGSIRWHSDIKNRVVTQTNQLP